MIFKLKQRHNKADLISQHYQDKTDFKLKQIQNKADFILNHGRNKLILN